MNYQGLPGLFWDPREPAPCREELARFGPFGGRGAAHAAHAAFYQVPFPQAPAPEVENIRIEENLGVPEIREPVADDGFLPPVSVSINANITHDTARVTVTQLFVNNSRTAIPKVSYTFPLPPESTVIDFSCRIGRDKILKGKVKPKGEARETFDQAVRQNRTAGLLDQETPELFTTSLGNLEPGTRLKATISYILLLRHGASENSREGCVTFTLPTYIAPRYGVPTGDLEHLIARSASLAKLSISVDILAVSDIHSLICPSHASANIEVGVATRQRWADFVANRVTRDPRAATVRISDETDYLDRDFTLEIATAWTVASEKPFACLERHPNLPGHSALMVTIPRNFFLGSTGDYTGSEIIFIADRSGSMSDKIGPLKDAMAYFLAALPPGCSFNIWSFGSSFRSMWSHSQQYKESSRREAERYVESQFRANMGGTRLLEPLQDAVSRRGGFGNTDFIVLTDGRIWDLSATVEFVKETRVQTEGRTRFFSIGIGDAVSYELVEGIAKAGGGYAEVIHTASQGGWEGSVLSILEAAKRPHVSPHSIDIEWGGGSGDVHLADETANDTQQSPYDTSNLSPFMRNRVFRMLDHTHGDATPQAVRICCSKPGSDSEILNVPITALQVQDDTIHKFAARALLGDLERGESHIHSEPTAPERGSQEEANLERVEGERLGCKWSLVSKWTSFVAVEENVDESEQDDDPFLIGSDSDEARGVTNERRGLDLLRPRGPQNTARQSEGQPGQPRLEEDSSEEDDSSDTDMDTPRRGPNDSDSDSDDGQGPGPGGQSHGNPGSGSSQDSHRPQFHGPPASHGPDPGAPSSSGPSRHTAATDGMRVQMAHHLRPKSLSTSLYPQIPGVQYGAEPVSSSSRLRRSKDANETLVRGALAGQLERARSASEYYKRSGDSKMLDSKTSKSPVPNLRADEKKPLSRRTKMSKEPFKKGFFPKTGEMIAPQNNLPTTTYLQFSNPELPTDPLEAGKRQLLRDLLPLQSATTGEFLAKITTWNGEVKTMETVLGKNFEAFVLAFEHSCQGYVPQPSSLNKSSEAISRTLSVVVLLRRHFGFCSSLWQIIETDARAYLSFLGDSEREGLESTVSKYLTIATFSLSNVLSQGDALSAAEIAAQGIEKIVLVIPLPKTDTRPPMRFDPMSSGGSSASAYAPLAQLPSFPPQIGTTSVSLPQAGPGPVPFSPESNTTGAFLPPPPPVQYPQWNWSNPQVPFSETGSSLYGDAVPSQKVEESSSSVATTSRQQNHEQTRFTSLPRSNRRRRSRSSKSSKPNKRAIASAGPEQGGEKTSDPLPSTSSQKAPDTFLNEHEGLIRKLAAERETRSGVAVDEIEIPEDI